MEQMNLECDVMSGTGNVSAIIARAIEQSDKMQKEVAAHMGWTPPNFSNRLRNNTIDADEWVKIADFLGYEVKMVSKAGEYDDQRNRVGAHVTQQVNCITYNTRNAKPVCHTSEFAGSFFELNWSDDVGYFVVMYATWADKPTVIPVDDEAALMFMGVCKCEAGL